VLGYDPKLPAKTSPTGVRRGLPVLRPIRLEQRTPWWHKAEREQKT